MMHICDNHRRREGKMNGPLDSNQLFESEEEELEGQGEAWRYTFAFVESLAVKSVVLLGIPDMIARHGPNATLSLTEIVAGLPRTSQPPDVSCLSRILRFLGAKKFFRAVDVIEESGVPETRYGLTPASKWLVKERETSMVPMLLMQNDKRSVAPWHHFDLCVLQRGVVAFEIANGAHIWDYASAHPDYNRLFNEAMACNAKIVMRAVLAKYDGFRGLTSLLDVGGGTGTAVAEIVKAYPNIKGFNFDLPHVVATASKLPGVEHVGGDMFQSVPSADAVFMKWIMHDWGNEDCIKILKNCRKAIPETGKVIIVDVVLNGKAALDPTIAVVFDLVMIAHSSGGKERTEEEWKYILAQGGFTRYNIITIPALQSVIEAFPC